MKNILVAYDFSDDSNKAVQQAIIIAEKFHSHIWLLHVADPEPEFIGFESGPHTTRDQVALELRTEHKELQKTAALLKNSYENITPILVQGSTVETILSQADKTNSDIIFIGSKSKNTLETIFIGSTSEQVVKRAKKTIMICR